MKKLDRSVASKPTCLNNLSHPVHTWDNMNAKKKKKVWAEIDKFQHKLCVYCESPAFRGDGTGHIEHFFHKEQFRDKTFDWDNLFGCCPSNKHCGHYKDEVLEGGCKRVYDPALLIKPDKEDPNSFFTYSASGKIEAKMGISDNDKKKADETIKAVNLLASSLVQSREAQITRFQHKVDALLPLMESDATYEDAFLEYQKVKLEADKAPHRTAIKQAVIWL